MSGSGVITINADLRVGNVSETVNVDGETPVVDVQSTRRQSVVENDVINDTARIALHAAPSWPQFRRCRGREPIPRRHRIRASSRSMAGLPMKDA